MVGCDDFEDFELMVLVQESKFDSHARVPTCVRIRAGSHEVQTDDSGDGFYDQPLHIFIEQGTTDLVFELLSGRSILATHTMDISVDVLGHAGKVSERIFKMKSKTKRMSNARLKVAMNVLPVGSLEDGVANESGMSLDCDENVAMLVDKQLQKVDGAEGLSRAELMNQACAGPLLMFEDISCGVGRIGGKKEVYVTAYRTSKRRFLGVWSEKRDHGHNKPPWKRVDLLRVQSVQRDPSRGDVFFIIFFDEARVRQNLMFRRVDRHRDVWVSLLHDLIETAHKEHQDAKAAKHQDHNCYKSTKKH